MSGMEYRTLRQQLEETAYRSGLHGAVVRGDLACALIEIDAYACGDCRRILHGP